MKALGVESAELSMQSATLQTLLLTSTKTIVSVELLTTNLNELHIIGSINPPENTVSLLQLPVSVYSQFKRFSTDLQRAPR